MNAIDHSSYINFSEMTLFSNVAVEFLLNNYNMKNFIKLLWKKFKNFLFSVLKFLTGPWVSKFSVLSPNKKLNQIKMTKINYLKGKRSISRKFK